MILNKRFQKLCYEFNLNYVYQTEFRKYCDNLDIDMGAKTKDMQQARLHWSLYHKVWFRNTEELNAYIKHMPFNGYETEKDAFKVLNDYRKQRKAR